MKKLVLIAFAAILFAGCHKTGVNINTTTPATYNIVGKWFYTTDTLRTYTNGILTKTTPYVYDRTNYLQFNSDYTGEKLADTTHTAFTYSTAGPTVTMTFAQTANSTASAPRINTVKVLVVQNPTNMFSAEIRLATTENLVLFYPEETVSTDGTTVTTEAAYFSK